MNNIYLDRYAWPHRELDYPQTGNPDLIIVIPVFNEPELIKTLTSLHQCTPPGGEVLIIIVINESEDADQEIRLQNKKSYEQSLSVKQTFNQAALHIQLPQKKAGVGLARKIGMDEAVRIFESQNKDGIIVCFDADCTCDPNYLVTIENYYVKTNVNLGLVHYEHGLKGINKEAIINYELYLRYYIDALRIAKYPNAVQTLGSCITVKSSAYQKQGGMNQRKAGEDFYFIHKIIPLGKIGEINETTIYPSDRISDRVPFGTGHAIDKYLTEPNEDYPVYHFRTFEDLAHINKNLIDCYHSESLPENLPHSITTFYEKNNFDLKQIIKQSGDFNNFTQRYYQWWDGFRVLKYVHYCRDLFHTKVPLREALEWLDHQIPQINLKGLSLKEQLLVLREFDRNQNYQIK